MAVISSRWGELSDSEKNEYKHKAAEMNKKYQKDLASFLNVIFTLFTYIVELCPDYWQFFF